MADPAVQLQLQVGRTVAEPAPSLVMDAFLDLEVRNRDRERDNFQISFALGKGPQADYQLLLGGYFDPFSRVIVAVLIAGQVQVLIDGVVTDQQVVPSNRIGESRLVVTGEDSSLKMDLEEKNVSYPNQADSDIVTTLVTAYGFVPDVTATSDASSEEHLLPSQVGTDYSYVRQLASRHGFVFYAEPTSSPGTSRAHWGPENRSSATQKPLTMSMGPETTVDQPMNFSINALGPVKPKVSFFDLASRSTTPIPDPRDFLAPLERQPLEPFRTVVARDSGSLDFSRASLQALSSRSGSAEAVTVSGEVDAVRYGGVLRSRGLVRVRGVGSSSGGDYYVQEVVHRIKVGEYRQSFTLKREGRGALSSATTP